MLCWKLNVREPDPQDSFQSAHSGIQHILISEASTLQRKHKSLATHQELAQIQAHPYGNIQLLRYCQSENQAIAWLLLIQDVERLDGTPTQLKGPAIRKIFRKYIRPPGLLNLDNEILAAIDPSFVPSDEPNEDWEEQLRAAFPRLIEHVMRIATEDVLDLFKLSSFFDKYQDFLSREAHPVNLDSFQIDRAIGRGSYGKVNAVVKKDTGQVFALKTISKERVSGTDRSIEQVHTEFRILGRLNSPFIVNLHYAFHTESDLYMCFDLMGGGDLHHHMDVLKNLGERRLRFYAIELILGICYLHDSGVVHRDIKPDNMMFDGAGHVHLADFGLAADCGYDEDVVGDCGTPGYIAPEVITDFHGGFPSDWWSLGMCLYEMYHGVNPFRSKTVAESYEKMKTIPLQFSELMSAEFKNLLEQLLNADPNTRLGLNGLDDFVNHPFFTDSPWQQIMRRNLSPPFIPDYRAHVSPALEYEDLLQEQLGPEECTLTPEQQAQFSEFSFVNPVAYRVGFFEMAREGPVD
jgi:serine/threonine protein kinase